MDIDLEILVNKYLRDFESKRYFRVVVPNSIPIVWFGDLEEYKKSPVKIVTIGLNPSLNEFKEPRFDTHANNADTIYKTLCNYFYYNPYKVWFAQFEKCLKRMDASYGGKMSDTRYTDTAIHIDAYSSIATAPTWSKLTQREKDSVNQQELCQRLFDYLQPDIVLMSTAHNVFYDTLNITCSPCLYYDYKGKRVVEIYKQHGQILIWGQTFGGAFGGIPNEILDEAFETYRI